MKGLYSNELILFTPVQSLTKHSQARVIFDESVDITIVRVQTVLSNHFVTNTDRNKASYP